MISINGFKIIGVDDGYGNIKTANHDFRPASSVPTLSPCSPAIC